MLIVHTIFARIVVMKHSFEYLTTGIKFLSQKPLTYLAGLKVTLLRRPDNFHIQQSINLYNLGDVHKKSHNNFPARDEGY